MLFTAKTDIKPCCFIPSPLETCELIGAVIKYPSFAFSFSNIVAYSAIRADLSYQPFFRREFLSKITKNSDQIYAYAYGHCYSAGSFLLAPPLGLRAPSHAQCLKNMEFHEYLNAITLLESHYQSYLQQSTELV